jgi:ribosomal protein S27E
MKNDYSRKYRKEHEKDIQIECPHCFHENSVQLSSEVKCKECKKPLTGKLYKSVVFSTALLIGTGVIGGAIIDDTVNINRASVKTEYKMMRTCLHEFSNRDNCFCAVESMSGFLDAEKARFYSRESLAGILKDRYESCTD